MGILSWLTGEHFDERDERERLDEEHAGDPYWSREDSIEDNEWIGPLAKRRDEECKANDTPYGHGQAEARYRIDDMRRYWHQYGAGSFREAVEVSGKYWDHLVQVEGELVAQGHADRLYHLEFAKGARSIYD